MAPGARPAGSPSGVEDELAALWREASTDGRAVLRACSSNLVIVCDDGPEDLRRATELAGRLSETVPGRALVVGPTRERHPDRLDVYVSAHCHRGADGAQVCSEQITLEPTPTTRDRIPATVLQLLVEEMPVYTLWRRPLEGELLRPLVRLSDYWIVDSDAARGPECPLESLRALRRLEGFRGQLRDVAWARLEAWRDAVASFFDHPALRVALGSVSRIEIASAADPAGPAPVGARYLAGWLASRLRFAHALPGWRRADGSPVEIDLPTAPGAPPGGPIAVTIQAGPAEAPVRFRTVRAEEREGCLRMSVESPAHRLPERRIQLPSHDETALLCGVLQRTGDDPVYDAALNDAVRLGRA